MQALQITLLSLGIFLMLSASALSIAIATKPPDDLHTKQTIILRNYILIASGILFLSYYALPDFWQWLF